MYYIPGTLTVILHDMDAERLSRYEIRERLGRGGMASVYRAYDPSLHREVALKLLNQELLDDPQVRERFERETKIIARLEHEAIVPVHEVGRENDQVFFVMRYMSGGSLAERLERRSKLSFPQMSKIIQRVAAALDYAHERGVIHRDLKPSNILFDEYDNAYLSDFDIAKLTPSGSTQPPGSIVGKTATGALWSQHVFLLPFMEQLNAHERIAAASVNFTKSNSGKVDLHIVSFQCPSDPTIVAG